MKRIEYRRWSPTGALLEEYCVEEDGEDEVKVFNIHPNEGGDIDIEEAEAPGPLAVAGFGIVFDEEEEEKE
jgi:hypothetical protein